MTTEATPLTREQAIEKLMWSGGGAGFGLCSTVAMDIWSLQTPKRGEKDWKATVTVQGDPKDYTDEELFKLVAFSEAQTARYDKIFKVRMGANLIVIHKQAREGGPTWLRKRMSWEMGPMYSDTLDEAIKVLAGN